MKIRHQVVFALLVPFTVSAGEGYFRIADLKREPGYRDVYQELKDCGGVRIHATRSLVLTALHCVTNELGRIDPSSTRELGDQFAFDSLNFFADLRDHTLPGGEKIVAHGRCFTGLDLEVLEGESEMNRKDAFRCARGDWAILELPQVSARQCARVTGSADPGSPVIAMGAARVDVVRNVGLKKLAGQVYSRGVVGSPKTWLELSDFSLGDLWRQLLDSFESELQASFVLTDADVINGMSGGPVLNPNFELVATTSVALLPTNIWKYPGVVSMVDGYNRGIHGAVHVGEIRRQLQDTGVNPQTLFHCP